MSVPSSAHMDMCNSILDAEKRKLAEAARSRGTRPPQLTSRKELHQQQAVLDLRASLATVGKDDGTGDYMTPFIIVPPSYPPSAVPFAALGKISFRQMLLETHHGGRYLLVRTLIPPVRGHGIGTIVEDEEGDTLSVYLHHQLKPQAQQETAEMVLPPNRVLVIKEPYFKVIQPGRSHGIQVEHVSDIVWLAPDDDRIPASWRDLAHVVASDANAFRQEGNVAFKAGYYRQAVEKYTLALKRSGDEAEAQAIRLNRAMAYLNLGCYDAALEDASCACVGEKPPEKVLYRAAMALYRLGRFLECRGRLELLLRLNPLNEAGRQLMKRVLQRLYELKTGKYNFDSMYDSVHGGNRHLDIATFCGPVAFRPLPGHRGGLFTTRAVTAGELLLCEKAFVYHGVADHTGSAPIEPSPGEPSSLSGISTLINMNDDSATIGTLPDLIDTAIQKISRSPSLLPTFTSLYSGSYTTADAPLLVDGQPVVDSFLVERIISLNFSRCPSSSYGWFVERRRANTTTSSRSLSDTADPALLFCSCGVWPLASRARHSCIGTVHRSFIGDAVILRAATNLAAGAELAYSHLPMHQYDNDAVQEALSKQLRARLGSECRCALCLNARATPASTRHRRLALLEDVAATVTAVRKSFEEAASDPRNNNDSLHAVRPTLELCMLSWLDQVAKAERLAAALARAYEPTATTSQAAASGGGDSGDSGVNTAAEHEGSHGGAALVAPAAPTLLLGAARTHLAAAWCELAVAAPEGPDRHLRATKAVAAALGALRAFGFVVRGPDLPPIASGAHAGGNRGGVNNDDDGARLRVVKWGYIHHSLCLIWEQLVKAYMLGLAEDLMVEALLHLRTAYCIVVGENEATFSKAYAGTLMGQLIREFDL